MLKQRIITGLILALGFLAILFVLPTAWFALLLGLIVMVAAWEWANLAGLDGQRQRCAYALAVGAMCALLATAVGLPWAMDVELVRRVVIAGCVWWALALLWVQGYPSSALLWNRSWLIALLGLPVLVPAWLAMVFLHGLAGGAWLVLLLMLAVACADIGAYFSGKAFGRRKLAPAVSPGKSWEGFWGGFACGVVLALLVGLLGGGIGQALVAVVPACLASVLGDLAESMFKRQRGIKDSSQLLPGHGGLLDRVDGVTAAAPVFALGVLVTGWAG